MTARSRLSGNQPQEDAIKDSEKCLSLSFARADDILYSSRIRAGDKMDIPNIKERRKHNIRFPMPDIPREAWCDFRIDFVEKNMTLVQLAKKYYCDPRTVRNCNRHNKSSIDLVKKTTPTRIQVYEVQVRELLLQNIEKIPDDVSTVYGLSHYLYPLLQEQGYTGSERTLRNHLQKQSYIKAVLEKQTNRDNYIKNEPENSSEQECL